jgi:hypothetical protein
MLLPNDLHQHALAPPPAEVPIAFGDSDHHLTAHDLALDVRVG